MSIMQVTSGNDVPREINVIIEIPMNGGPVKYEMDKASGMLRVDRLMATSMRYPANYGYIPQTLSEDGDPVDVLVLTPVPLLSGVLIPCKPIGKLNMTDESGVDAKIIAIPTDKLCTTYHGVSTYTDLPGVQLEIIEHFFSHYKDLEKGKWVKISGWEGPDAAYIEILYSIERYIEISA